MAIILHKFFGAMAQIVDSCCAPEVHFIVFLIYDGILFYLVSNCNIPALLFPSLSRLNNLAVCGMYVHIIHWFKRLFAAMSPFVVVHAILHSRETF